MLNNKQADKKQQEAKIIQSLDGILKDKNIAIKDYHNYLDDNLLSQETLDICQKADEQEFNDGSASSFNEVYKRCMK
jgi:hypothetical protein